MTTGGVDQVTELRKKPRTQNSGAGLFLRAFLFFWTDPERNFRRCRRGQYLGLIRLMNEYGFAYDEEDRRVYFSQYGQDKFVAEHLFPGMMDGVFVDVGAYDGVTISNSCFFEREMGWTGLCVEPIPDVFKELVANRPGSICENVCVSNVEGELEFARVEGVEALSGIADRMDRRHRRRIKSEGGRVEMMRLPSLRLQTLLDRHGIDRIDFLSIDTEGAELDVIRSLDFERTCVNAVCVENNSGERKVRRHLEQNGLAYLLTLGDLDDLYVRAGR